MCIGFDLDNPRRNVDCWVRLGEGKVPSPRALSTLSTRSLINILILYYYESTITLTATKED